MWLCARLSIYLRHTRHKGSTDPSRYQLGLPRTLYRQWSSQLSIARWYNRCTECSDSNHDPSDLPGSPDRRWLGSRTFDPQNIEHRACSHSGLYLLFQPGSQCKTRPDCLNTRRPYTQCTGSLGTSRRHVVPPDNQRNTSSGNASCFRWAWLCMQARSYTAAWLHLYRL